MNAWNNIKAAQTAYDLIHQKNLNESISDYDPLYIYCAGDNKPRIRNYKNFLIYLINHYHLTDMTDETNLTFEKLSRKIKILLQNEKSIKREIAKSI